MTRAATRCALSTMIFMVACSKGHSAADAGMTPDAAPSDSSASTDTATPADSGPGFDGGVPAWTWEAGPVLPMMRRRVSRQIRVAENGTVLFAFGALAGPSKKIDFLLNATSSWQPYDVAENGLSFMSVSAVPDGRFLATGFVAVGDDFNAPARGNTFATTTGDSYIVDSVTETAQIVPPMLTSRGMHRAVTLMDGRVLACGGWHGEGVPATDGPTTSCERYDLPMGHWIATASMGTGRYAHTLTLLADGKVLAAGGHDVDGHAIRSAEVYDPVADAWHAVGDLAHARAWAEAQRLPSGEVLVMGGETEETYGAGESLSSAELFDPMSETFHAAPDLPWRGSDFASLTLPSGRVVISGGRDRGPNHNVANVAMYDESVGTWQMWPAMSEPRAEHSMVQLRDGRLMVISGYTDPLLNEDGTSEITTEAVP